MRRKIWVTFDFEMFHCYPDAPDEVAFLRNLHRHLFKFKVSWYVTHLNRDREFFIERRACINAIAVRADRSDTHVWSCEQWAEYLLKEVDAAEVTVSEDGENGATVTK